MVNQAKILDLANLKRVAETAENMFAELCKSGGDDLAEAWHKAELEFMDAANSTAVLALMEDNDRLQKLVSWQGEGNTKITVNAGPVMKLMDERDQLKAENDTLRKAAAGAIKYVAFAFDQGIEGAEAAGIALENAAARAARL